MYTNGVLTVHLHKMFTLGLGLNWSNYGHKNQQQLNIFFLIDSLKEINNDIISTNTEKNKEERYSRVPRLSDTRYSKGNGDMEAAKRD